MVEFEPILDPPEKKNGKVSTSEFYRALHQLDEGLTRRFTTLLDAINDSNAESQQLRADLEDHRKHLSNDSPVKRTAKSASLLAFFTAIFTAIAVVIRDTF